MIRIRGFQFRPLLSLVLLCALSALALSDTAGAGELRSFVHGSWQALRAAHAGRPTVVHVWGITCGPCRVELPNWGKLLQERPELDLVLINADLVPDDPGDVSTILQSAGLAAAESWIFDDAFGERLRYEIDPRWQGEIPRTLLIARDGSTTTVEGVADLAMVRAWLERQGETAK
jgi:thiol-disulfide isomerase/thioredoxin